MSSSDLLAAALLKGTPIAYRVRRAAFVRKARLLASMAGSTLEVDVALDARIGRHVLVTIAPGTSNRLLLGPETVIGDHCELQLSGGTIELGGWSELRKGVVLKSGGVLRMGEACTMGAGCHLHCASELILGDRVGFGEYVSVVDSSHHHKEPGRPMFWDSVHGSVHIGNDVFVGAKATLTRSARIGDYSIVGASSVVVGEVPARTLVSGVPAKPVKAVELGWE